jgi:outer membrane lipoprotein-sorting protein
MKLWLFILIYSNMKANTGLTDSGFEIHLPRDVKIMDVK